MCVYIYNFIHFYILFTYDVIIKIILNVFDGDN